MAISIRDDGQPAAKWQVYDDRKKISAHRSQSAAKKAAETWLRKKKGVVRKRGKKATSRGHIRWRRNRPYVYRSDREGGTVRSRYWGTYTKWRQKYPDRGYGEFSVKSLTLKQMDILEDIDRAHGAHVWKS